MGCVKYLQNFVYVNGLLLTGGALTYNLVKHTPNYIWCIPCMYFKNLFLAKTIAFSKRNTPYNKQGKRNTSHDDYYLIQSAFYDTLTLLYLIAVSIPKTIKNDILFFLPKLFIYEIVFDFFHYWSHRIMHSFPNLYKYHAVHHAEALLDPYKAFYHSPVDLLLTNFIPLVLTSHLINISKLFACLFLWYKTLTEIGGHNGKYTHASSFPLCIALPRMLGIELRSNDHENHHTTPTKNFSKRFSLWDRAFGTFADSNKL